MKQAEIIAMARECGFFESFANRAFYKAGPSEIETFAARIAEKAITEQNQYLNRTELQRGFNRYEALRKLNVRQFTELHRRNLAGERFDDMVDALVAGSPVAQQENAPVLPVCLMCNGHGVLSNHAHDGSWDDHPCPDCNPALPTMPRPYVPCDGENPHDFYTADQMREYALAAIAAAGGAK